MKTLSRALAVLFTMFLLFSSSAFTQTADRYIVLEGTTALAHVYNASDNTEVAAIKAGNTPSGAVLSGNGRLAFVANVNSEYVSVIDLTIQSEIRRIRGLRVGQLALTPDGSTVIGADLDDSKLKLIDAATFNVTQMFDLNGKFGDDPNDLFDLTFGVPVLVGNKVYLNTNFGVGALDLGTGTVALVSTTTFGRNDFFHNIAATADRRFVAAVRGDALLVIDPASNTVVRSLPGFFACVVASNNPAAPDVVFVVRGTGGSTFFSSLDVSTGQFLEDLPLPQAFADTRTQIATNADSSKAYVGATATNPDLVVIDTTLGSLVAQFNVGVRAVPAAVGSIQLQPPTSAPVVTTVTPGLIVNNADTTIQISGSGFASDAQVRVGTLDPIAAQVTSASQLQVTIPATSAAQGAPIIVTNPNVTQGVPGGHQSGVLRNAFVIATPPTFQPVNQVAVPNSAESTFAVLNVSTNTTLAPAVATGTRPLGLAILPDGSRAFIENLFAPAAIDVYNFATNTIEAHIILNPASAGFPGQTKGIILAPIFGTSRLAAYVDVSHPVAGGFSVDVDVIGADPASPGFETVLATIPTGAPNPTGTPGAIAVTPDGHYAFIQTFQRGVSNDVNFTALDLSTGVSTTIPGSTFGFTGFQANFELSSDGKFLVVEADSGLLPVLDVGTNPFNPTVVATVGTVAPGGFLLSRVVASRLYAFDPSHNFIDIFNFNPAVNDFTEQGNFTFSGASSVFGNVLDVTPDGKLIYLPLREEDAVAVVDATKVIAKDPAALVAKIGTGISPSMVAVRPGTPTPAGSNVAVQPIPEVSLNFSSVSTTGVTSATTTNTNPDPLPAGFSLGTPPIYYEISTTAVFAPPVQVCVSYNPAQFTGPEANIRLLHDENGTFVDVTTSLDTLNRVVCGQVTHFSAFTVGIASVDFFFHTLLTEINSGVADQGELRSLVAKVQAAQASFDRGQHQTAGSQLNAFENEVRAQTGKRLSAGEASRLVQLADTILGRL
jgi:hypothetical protein